MSGQNTGVSGTRHSVADPKAVPIQYADSGVDDVSASYDETDGRLYEEPPTRDDGIAILEGVVTTEVPASEETPAVDMPKPEWNQPITVPPHPVGAEQQRQETMPGVSKVRMIEAGGAGTNAGSGGQPRTSVRDLPPDVRLRLWQWRAVIVIVVGAVFTVIASWQVGLTLAILAGIIDTSYRALTAGDIQAGGSQARAKRRTRGQLSKMRRAGYLTLDARPIPNSREVIDHLVVGPTGVYAIDSEQWHRKMPIRTWNGKQLWHGPDSKKQRLEHARWEARQASELLSAALGTEIVVRPAMAVYGPKVPWDIATIRDVDVFSGPALGKYLKRRARVRQLPRLDKDQVRRIYETAGRVLPDVAPTRTVTPVG